MQKNTPCRLCGSATEYKFSKIVLKKHDVGYFECKNCKSLQTDAPFWLEEAYEDPRRFTDTAAVERNLKVRNLVYFTSRLFHMNDNHRLLDWGAGDGLLVRLLRDVNIDAYHYDKYSTNMYAPSFDRDPGGSYFYLTAVEVFEHLPDPSAEIAEMMAHQPDVILATTQLYRRQGPDWSYIWPQYGRHVFFFSDQAMDWIGEKHGYRRISADGLHLFFRQGISPIKKRYLRYLMRKSGSRPINVLFSTKRKRSLANADRQSIVDRDSRRHTEQVHAE